MIGRAIQLWIALDPLNTAGTRIGYPGNAGIGGQLDIGMSPAISAGMAQRYNLVIGSQRGKDHIVEVWYVDTTSKILVCDVKRRGKQYAYLAVRNYINDHGILPTDDTLGEIAQAKIAVYSGDATWIPNDHPSQQAR